MSSRIEDLSDSDSEDITNVEDVIQNDLHEEDYYNESDTGDRVERFEEVEKTNTLSINQRIIKMLVEKVKEPMLVTFIMIFLTHPLLIQGIFRIPYVDVVEHTISVNVVLSILAGIIFFIIREFV